MFPHLFPISLLLRAVMSAFTSFLIVCLAAPAFIHTLSRLQLDQTIRSDGPQSHLKKAGTPTMGGLLLLAAITISVLLYADLKSLSLWIVLFSMLSFGLLGWVDDYRKIARKSSRGLPAKVKFFWQSMIAIGVACVLYFSAQTPIATAVLLPFAPGIMLHLGVFYFVLVFFVVVGSSNALNLTDGLDGLAILPVIAIGLSMGVLAYLMRDPATLLQGLLPYSANASEMVVFCAALVAAGLGFLWYNITPAAVFMGDVGSLALGATLGVIAIMIRQELTFFLMSGVLVAEAVSVALQVAYYKMTKRRIFRMAPLHHHFELKGWSEPQVVLRFWIVTVLCIALGWLGLWWWL